MRFGKLINENLWECISDNIYHTIGCSHNPKLKCDCECHKYKEVEQR